MAAHEFSHHHRGTPAQFANRRALNPYAIVTALVILVLILAIGKVSWAVKAYDRQIDLYKVEASER